MNRNPNTSKVTTKKIGNNLNSSIRFRSSSSDLSINHRKSFPSSSSSDLCSALNSSLQVNFNVIHYNFIRSTFLPFVISLSRFWRNFYVFFLITHQKNIVRRPYFKLHKFLYLPTSSNKEISIWFIDYMRE